MELEECRQPAGDVSDSYGNGQEEATRKLLLPPSLFA
jgi:hypothetical protein